MRVAFYMAVTTLIYATISNNPLVYMVAQEQRALAASQVNQEQWVGRQVMPKMDAKFKTRERGVLPWSELDFPLTVKQVNGKWLGVGKAWVLAQSMMPLEDSLKYYSEFLRQHPRDSEAQKLFNISLLAATDSKRSTEERLDQPDFDGPDRGGIVLSAEKFAPGSLPPNFPIHLRGLPNYRFRVSGSPEGTKYRLWYRNLGEDSKEAIPAGSTVLGDEVYFTVNEEGLLTGRARSKEAKLSFNVGESFRRGESIDYCLLSTDGKLQSCVAITPYPLEATNEAGYRVSMKLLDISGVYSILATGFEPNQEVKFVATEGEFFDIADSRHDAKTGMRMFTHKGEEDKKRILIAFWKPPRNGGGASELTVTGKSGQVRIGFDWGTSIKAPRDMAVMKLDAVLKDKSDAPLRDLNDAIEIDPTYVQAYLMRCLYWRAVGQADKAIADASEAIRLDPSFAVSYYVRGLRWYEEGEYEKSIADCSVAIRLDSNHDKAYAKRGDAQRKLGKLDKAIQDYSEAIRIEPKSVDAYNKRGLAWERKSEYEKAIADFTAAVEIDATFHYGYNNRARCWTKKEDYDKAIVDHTKAIKQKPDFKYAYRDRGDAYKKLGDYAKSIQDYTEAIRLDPKFAIAYNNLAWLYSTCPDPQFRDGAKAVEHSRTSCELTSWKQHSNLDTLAAAYAEAGDFAEAIRWQEKAIEMAEKSGYEEGAYKARLESYKSGKPYYQKGP